MRGSSPVTSCQTTREDTWLIKMRVKRVMKQTSKYVPTVLARPHNSSWVHPPLFHNILVKHVMNSRAFGRDYWLLAAQTHRQACCCGVVCTQQSRSCCCQILQYARPKHAKQIQLPPLLPIRRNAPEPSSLELNNPVYGSVNSADFRAVNLTRFFSTQCTFTHLHLMKSPNWEGGPFTC